MKSKRQRKIIDLIGEYDIDTQEELAKKLIESGFKVTQACPRMQEGAERGG